MYSRYHYRMGPVADPGPDPWGPWQPPRWDFDWRRPSPIPEPGDPAPYLEFEQLLPKEAQVQIKIKQIDFAITQLQGQIEVLQLAKETMAKEHRPG